MRKSSSGFLVLVLDSRREASEWNPRRTPFSLSLRMIRHGGHGGKSRDGKSTTGPTRVVDSRVLGAPLSRREFHREIHRFNGSTVAVRMDRAII